MDSVITREEFIEYYRNISSNIDDDQYFTQMMNKSWDLESTQKIGSSTKYGVRTNYNLNSWASSMWEI